MFLASRCAVCDRPGSSPCPACHARLRPVPPGPDPPGLDGLVCLLRYDGSARELIARLKYRNRRLALGWLADGLAGRLVGVGVGVGVGVLGDGGGPSLQVVTWAPTTFAHRYRRGFDHGELLARAVGRRLGVPARSLLRRRAGPAQTGRSADERVRLGPRFSVSDPVGPGTRVLVLDDVVTTGATLRAAVAALRAAGAVAVPAALARVVAVRPGPDGP